MCERDYPALRRMLMVMERMPGDEGPAAGELRSLLDRVGGIESALMKFDESDGSPAQAGDDLAREVRDALQSSAGVVPAEAAASSSVRDERSSAVVPTEGVGVPGSAGGSSRPGPKVVR